ncbi:MAG: 30S ribosomal protein S9 [Spirochaetales bacterium]|nr:30S ribosomal protein S9 [Spirochaetales bacterium]
MGTGRRKTAVARVYLREGSGTITVNGKSPEDYFAFVLLADNMRLPLEVTDTLKRFDVVINVRGGGLAGQSDACKHGLARALQAYDASNKTALRANGFLTRDDRMVERKKYGQRGARRRFQFSKR